VSVFLIERGFRAILPKPFKRVTETEIWKERKKVVGKGDGPTYAVSNTEIVTA